MGNDVHTSKGYDPSNPGRWQRTGARTFIATPGRVRRNKLRQLIAFGVLGTGLAVVATQLALARPTDDEPVATVVRAAPAPKTTRDRPRPNRPRRSLLAMVEPAEPVVRDEPTRPSRPDLVSALPSSEQPAVVIEVGQLWSRPIGQLVRRCLDDFVDELDDPVRAERARNGVATLYSVERVATDGNILAVSGEFGDGLLQALLGGKVDYRAHGANSFVLEKTLGPVHGPGPDHGPMPIGALIGGDTAVLGLGPMPDFEAAIDRVENGESDASAILPDHERYGQAYGRVPKAAIAKMFGHLPMDLGALFRDTVDEVALHVDAPDDLLVTVDLRTKDEGSASTLADVLRASIGFATALNPGHDFGPYAGLLTEADIQSSAGQVTIRTRVPLDLLEAELPFCKASRS